MSEQIDITPDTSVVPVLLDETPLVPVETIPGPSVDDLRHAEYIKPGGADSLYMKWQAGEGTEAEWLAERERVRLLYPDPDE